MLQKQRTKGAKDWKSGGRRIVPGMLLKLLVKDKLPHSREVPMNAKEWQLKSLRREKEDYSVWALTNMKGWQLKPRRKKIIADENQPARKFGIWKPRGERKITADEHQPARKVGSWKPREERLQQMSTNQHERLTVECSWYLMKVFIPSVTILSEL